MAHVARWWAEENRRRWGFYFKRLKEPGVFAYGYGYEFGHG